MNFPITVEIENSSESFTVVVDVPDFESAIYEMKKLAKDVCGQLAIIEARMKLPDDAITVNALCLGYSYTSVTSITPEFIERVKKNEQVEEKAKKMIDMESVKHDIMYAINMLRTPYAEGDTRWVYNESIVWLYYSLHKHFGDPLPEEILTAQSKIKEEQEGKK